MAEEAGAPERPSARSGSPSPWAWAVPAFASRRASAVLRFPSQASRAPMVPARVRARRGADRLRRSCAHQAVLHLWARLRQVSTSGKTAARVQNAHRGARVAILRARWNDEITRALAQGAVQAALAADAKVEEFEVAGSFELPRPSRCWRAPDVSTRSCPSAV